MNDIVFTISEEKDITFTIDSVVQTQTGSYAPLPDKPQINHRVLQAGNNTYDYLGVQETIEDITEQDIDNLIYGG